MWNLNDFPELEQQSPDGAAGDGRGKRVDVGGSTEEMNDNDDNDNDDTSSSTVVMEPSDEEAGGGRKRLLGDPQERVVTRQFFPASEQAARVSPALPRAHWVGVKFCPGKAAASDGTAAAAGAQTAKKSRRGPRSRSSQYRGVTFYRRTGRWESHIWSVDSVPSPPSSSSSTTTTTTSSRLD